MNSIWNKNISLFKTRFPSLNVPETPPSLMEVFPAKSGDMTATYKGLPLHSKYSPINEAVKASESYDGNIHKAALFYSCGLGYLPLLVARNNPDATIIILEPEKDLFFDALTYTDMEDLFRHQKLIIALDAGEEALKAILSSFDPDEICIFNNKNQSAHNSEYYEEVTAIINWIRDRNDVNNKTLEKFGKLWLKNSCRNLKRTALMQGVSKFQNLGENLPFVIIAAGPSLGKLIPHLAQIQKRAVTVCVDTALHILLKNNIQPDFIIIADPQYAAGMHLEFLKAPESVLIAEGAVYPDVLDFECREKVLCTSMFPIGQYFEMRMGIKGILKAGGSVTTTAWDFARFCGAKNIYIAAMDFGFPGKETHVKGSQFEERAIRTSNRYSTVQEKNIASLMSAGITTSTDYTGNTLLTDRKMSLFSQWFQNECSRENAPKTWSLTAESLAIPGINYFSLEKFLTLPEIDKTVFYKNADKNSMIFKQQQKSQEEKFNLIYRDFMEKLDSLEKLARKGRNICRDALKNPAALTQKSQEIFAKLKDIDSMISSSNAKDAASLVFPTPQQLAGLTKNLPKDPVLYSINYSLIVYTELENSIKKYLNFLN